MKLSEISVKQIAPYKKWRAVQKVLSFGFFSERVFFFCISTTETSRVGTLFCFWCANFFSGGTLPHVMFCFIVFVLLTRFFFFPLLSIFVQRNLVVFQKG